MLIMKNKKLLLKQIDDTEEKDGLIYTHDQKHKNFSGVILATANESEYKINTTVIFSEFSGEEVWVDGKKNIIIDEENIWAVREEK